MGGEGTTLYNDVWSSADGDSWVRVDSAAPWAPRFRATSAAFDGKLWIMGGMGTGSHNDVWCSTDGDSWIEVTAAAGWAPRRGHCTVVFDNKLWVFGGNAGVVVNDVWYSPDGDTWVEADSAAPWQPRGGAASVVWRDTVWLMGGVNSISGNHYLNDVWFSADGANWTEAESAAAWAPRRGLSALVLHDTLWVMAGDSGAQMFNDVWYTVDGITWLQATPGAEWLPRWNAGSGVFLDQMWIFAGWGYNGLLYRDVWSANGLAGIESGRGTAAANPEFLSLSPNPFQGATLIAWHLPQPGPARLTIRSRTGAVIRTWADRQPCAGTGRFCWDGRDNAGRAVPAGVYFVSLESREFMTTGKVTRLE
jgi:hypothetical protein